MEFTLLGVITIIISIYAFFRNEKLLLYMLVFLSTFTATKIFTVNITTTPIVTFEFTGVMWLLREFINFVKSKPKISLKEFINKFKENKLAIAFSLLIIAIILGEFYLAVSGLTIEYTDTGGSPATVQFCKTNVTQAIIICGLLFIMIVLSFKIKTREEIRQLLKVFCISTIFAVIWGLLQFITYYFGIPYPAFLFNNNEYAAQCYDQIDNNIKRISSIALEPSTFAINLACFIPFILGAFLKMKGKVTEKKQNIITFLVLILTTVCAILTTSSTTYVGLIVSYGIFLVYILFGYIKKGELSDKKNNFLKIFVATVTSIAVAACLCIVCVKIGYKLGTIEYITEEPVQEEVEEEIEPEVHSAFENMMTTLKQMTIGKLASGSGQERLQGDAIGLSLYKYSVIFGIGFGSYRTFTLFTNILTNAGILRSCIIFIYPVYRFKSTVQISKKRRNSFNDVYNEHYCFYM